MKKILTIMTIIFCIMFSFSYIITPPPTIKTELVNINNISISISYILSNNLYGFFKNILLTPLTFGVSSLSYLIFNALNIGSYIKQTGFSTNLLLFIPHAIVELPAIVLTSANSFYFIFSIIKMDKKAVIKSLKFLLLNFVLFVVAGFIEVFITPMIIKFFSL